MFFDLRYFNPVVYPAIAPAIPVIYIDENNQYYQKCWLKCSKSICLTANK